MPGTFFVRVQHRVKSGPHESGRLFFGNRREFRPQLQKAFIFFPAQGALRQMGFNLRLANSVHVVGEIRREVFGHMFHSTASSDRFR